MPFNLKDLVAAYIRVWKTWHCKLALFLVR
ncbi:hypothetical protein J2S17_002886 [Cytobacillus purgationiresistens]|uniref:Uncharacterized protein n=1 Tax=Cytobacillus purgationiresistens TaxID=863449 RepID=A0ABU0AIB6_9BACI|nr:hypothetical protein [Cytobacillus purgationiresistens]